MTGVWITLALGAIIIIFDYNAATKPDEKDKLKRRKPMSKQAKDSLRQMFFGTLVAAGAVYLVGQMWD
jgi:hypothetical protein